MCFFRLTLLLEYSPVICLKTVKGLCVSLERRMSWDPELPTAHSGEENEKTKKDCSGLCLHVPPELHVGILGGGCD